MALAERKDCKDYIGVYYTWNWELVCHFEVHTSDLSDIAWTLEDNHIIAIDTYLEYKLIVYTPTGM
jgi:hypothetical protein